MTAVLPVWSTTKAILVYARDKRTLAIRYAIPPVAALLVIDLCGIAAGIDIEKNPWWAIVTTILTLIAYAPFTVTWFNSIVLGETEARTRPIFGFTYLEKNVILANIRVTAAILIITLIILAIAGGLVYGSSLVIPGAMEIFGAIIAVPALFIWTMDVTRLSVAIAYSAAGEPITLREAFRLTRPMAFRVTWVHIILATLSFAIVAIAAALTTVLGIEKGVAVSIGLAIVNAIGGFVYLILVTTLFGFVYRRLREINPA
jgi:hypothetical protein